MQMSRFQIYAPGITIGRFSVYVIEINEIEVGRRKLTGSKSLEIGNIKSPLIKRYWRVSSPVWLDRFIENSHGWDALKKAELLIANLKYGGLTPEPDFERRKL